MNLPAVSQLNTKAARSEAISQTTNGLAIRVYGEKGGAEAAADAFGVSGIPHLFLINAEGKVEVSNLMATEAEKRIEKMLAKGEAP